MAERKLQGVIPILLTPFDDHGHIDTESLQNLVEFNIKAGVHGLGIALGSEVFKLNESERDQVTRVVVDQVRGRVPVVVNTGAPGTDLAVFYSQRAQELGADAVMVMPPSFIPPTPQETRSYFKAISDAITIPIVIQDHPNGPVPPSLVRQIREESPRALYCKVETPPTPPRVAQAVQECAGKVTIMGGAGGNFLLEELRRGSQGTMPSCSQPSAYVRIWNKFCAGDEEGATRIFYEEVLPLNRLSASGMGAFYQVNKELLVRLGVIKSAYVRPPFTPLDEVTRKEMDAVLERIVQYESAPRGRS